MKYWKLGNNNTYAKTDNNNMFDIGGGVIVDASTFGYSEITKTEYDKAVTLPAMSQENINHNYFNNAESALKLSKTLYLEEVKNRIVQGDATAPQEYKDFLAYMEAVIDTELKRAIAIYDAQIAGDDITKASNKAIDQVIPQDNYSAVAGRDAFLKWAIVKFPQLRTYVSYVDSLNYSTFITEDEPE